MVVIGVRVELDDVKGSVVTLTVSVTELVDAAVVSVLTGDTDVVESCPPEVVLESSPVELS